MKGLRKLTMGERIFGWGVYRNARNIERISAIKRR
jgi:hypothetical protein